MITLVYEDDKSVIYGISSNNNNECRAEIINLLNTVDGDLILEEVKLVSYGSYRIYFNKN